MNTGQETSVSGHTDGGRGKCSACPITTFKAFLNCTRPGNECDFELDKPITVPVVEAQSDEEVAK